MTRTTSGRAHPIFECKFCHPNERILEPLAEASVAFYCGGGGGQVVIQGVMGRGAFILPKTWGAIAPLAPPLLMPLFGFLDFLSI